MVVIFQETELMLTTVDLAVMVSRGFARGAFPHSRKHTRESRRLRQRPWRKPRDVHDEASIFEVFCLISDFVTESTRREHSLQPNSG